MNTNEAPPSTIGVKRFLAWMADCKRLGWAKEDMTFLADLFWKYKDRDGNLKKEPRS